MKTLQIISAIASISSWVIAIYFQWQGEEQLRVIVAVATGMVFPLIVGFSFVTKKGKNNHAAVSKISGKVKIPNPPTDLIPGAQKGPIDIYYPCLFKHIPNLEIECIEGKIVIEKKEQRKDGFIIQLVKTPNSRSGKNGLVLRWIAKGILD